jgi:putative pyruvate formate lyase activating enzyme
MELMEINEPGYLALFRSGELKSRADALITRLACCDICPLDCGVDRLDGQKGFCRSGRHPIVSSYCAHRGEEPALSGTRGSGTIFFGNCNMRCVYCQNYQISQDPENQQKNEIDTRILAERMLYLQNDLHCHNINLVSPSHFVPQIFEALLQAVPGGLSLPLVYNSGGYDKLETLRALDGVVDIYLPDIRYASSETAKKYSGVPDYVLHNRQSIKEMWRQVGQLQMDENEIAHRGLIVRHLILPEDIAGSLESLKWLARAISPEVTLSLMAQYYPCHQALKIAELSRTITYEEYAVVVKQIEKLGMENGWLQEMDAPTHYLPDFNREGHPFVPPDADKKF